MQQHIFQRMIELNLLVYLYVSVLMQPQAVVYL